MKKREFGPRIAFLEVLVDEDGFDAKLKAVKLVDDEGVKLLRGNEKTLLKKLMNVLRDVDLIVTWGGEKFDIPLLIVKVIRTGLDPTNLLEVFHFDVKRFFSDFFALNDVDWEKAAAFVGVKKGKGKAETVARIFEKLKPVLRVVKPELAV
ncbi:MAG: hypothetical protein QXF45_06485 [Candidatus Caldarchaeum sp.]